MCYNEVIREAFVFIICKSTQDMRAGIAKRFMKNLQNSYE